MALRICACVEWYENVYIDWLYGRQIMGVSDDKPSPLGVGVGLETKIKHL